MDDLIERIDTALESFDTFETRQVLLDARRALIVARSMLIDIREVQTTEDGFGEDGWGNPSIEWPNLAILADQLEEALK